MSEKVITPDLQFVKDVISSGGESLKKCFQCATCTVVCNVTPDDKPFPRKEMVQAQWGLKEELFGNPDIWLCHQCSDCTAYCPRGAKPGEVLGAIRKMSISNYSAPSFLSKMAGDSKFLVFLLAVPVLVFLAVIAVKGNLNIDNIPRGEGGGIVFDKFIPIHAIDPIFMAAFFFAAIVLGLGAKKYWADMSRHAGGSGNPVSGAVPVATEILTHENFRKCDVTSARGTSHLLVFYSFIGLAITTSMAVFYLYILKIPSPYSLISPLKIIGNVSAVALLIGIFLVIMNRLNLAEKAGVGSYWDWSLIGTITVIVLTGILSELTRLANVSTVAYPMYFVHLSAVLFLFLYAPYSKMAHMVYRATAMVFNKVRG